MAWQWSRTLHRYRDTITGRFATRDEVLDWVGESLSGSEDVVGGYAQLVGGSNPVLSPADWKEAMRRELKDEYIRQYILGKGGRDQMTPEDWGSIGGMLTEQYKRLDVMAEQIANGELTQDQVAARSSMYVKSAREGFEKGSARALGAPELPAYPGDGSTVCLCITTPESNILTSTGWKPLIDVGVGDLVLTHKMRWRAVIGTVVKPSLPYHKHATIKAPTGQIVGSTHDHLWDTPLGWRDSIDIDNSLIPVYNLRTNQIGTVAEVNYDSEEMYKLWQETIKQKQEIPLREMSGGMLLRKSERLQGGSVSNVWVQKKGTRTMGRAPSENGEGYTECCTVTADPVARSVREHTLAGKDGWAALDVVLGRRSEEDCLSLSMEMGGDKWSNTERACIASSGQEFSKRRFTESEIDESPEARSITRIELQGAQSAMEVPAVQGVIYKAAKEASRAEVLFPGMLPPGTPLYDIIVDEDHSFCIEGLFAHNTNCACNWRLEEIDDGQWLAFWELGPVDHCVDCLERAESWNPLEV